MLANLPVEIILLICEYPESKDLGQLAWTNKQMMHIIKKYLPIVLERRILFYLSYKNDEIEGGRISRLISKEPRRMAGMNGIHRSPIVAGALEAEASRNLDEFWSKFSEGLNTVYSGQRMSHEIYVSLYCEVYNYCTRVNTNADQHHEHHNMQPHEDWFDLTGMMMYKKLENYIRNHVIAKKEAMASFRGEELLVRYHKEWVNFCFSSKAMNGIFDYLNRNWIKRELRKGRRGVYTTFTLALMMWRQSLFMELKDYVTDALLDLIQRERDGIEINTTIIKGVIESYVDLSIDEYEPSARNTAIKRNANSRDKLRVYREHFEDRFIKKTEEYYSAEASNFLQNGSVVEYMKKVEKRLDEEQNRCGNYINKATQIPLAKALEKVFIQSRLELFQNELGGLLGQHKDEDLARMYKDLCEKFRSHCSDTDKDICQ